MAAPRLTRLVVVQTVAPRNHNFGGPSHLASLCIHCAYATDRNRALPVQESERKVEPACLWALVGTEMDKDRTIVLPCLDAIRKWFPPQGGTIVQTDVQAKRW